MMVRNGWYDGDECVVMVVMSVMVAFVLGQCPHLLYTSCAMSKFFIVFSVGKV